jgi:hypothetical protein
VSSISIKPYFFQRCSGQLVEIAKPEKEKYKLQKAKCRVARVQSAIEEAPKKKNWLTVQHPCLEVSETRN